MVQHTVACGTFVPSIQVAWPAAWATAPAVPVLPAGGCFVVEQIDQLVKEDPRYRPFAARIAGLAFDSAPCYMSLRVGATAIGFGMPWPLQVLAALLFFVAVSVEVAGQRGRVAGRTAGRLRPAGQQGATSAAPSCSSSVCPTLQC